MDNQDVDIEWKNKQEKWQSLFSGKNISQIILNPFILLIFEGESADVLEETERHIAHLSHLRFKLFIRENTQIILDLLHANLLGGLTTVALAKRRFSFRNEGERT